MPPTVPFTIRLHAEEIADLRQQAARAGVSTSEYVRSALGMHRDDTAGRLDAVERRLAQLEEIAGL